MARGPIVPPVPVAPPPRLVTLRITEPEAAFVVSVLRAGTAGGDEARRLAAILEYQTRVTAPARGPWTR